MVNMKLLLLCSGSARILAILYKKMQYRNIISTGVFILQGLAYVQAQSTIADCSDPAGIFPNQ